MLSLAREDDNSFCVHADFTIGSSAIRAGWSFEDKPRLNLVPTFSKYRDRKLGKTFSFVGADILADTTARSHMRNAFEAGTGIVTNWDVMESVLEYTWIKLGIDGASGTVDMPIVMTEAVANLPYSRKSKLPNDCLEQLLNCIQPCLRLSLNAFPRHL